jgi:phosphatidylglycerol:prolipoprotein diacylglycerol transferase
LYESLLNLIGFAVLMTYYVIKVRRKQYKWGTVSAFYLIWYGVTRAIIEPLRADALKLLGIRVTVIFAFAILICGLVLLWLVKKDKISQENKSCMKK